MGLVNSICKNTSRAENLRLKLVSEEWYLFRCARLRHSRSGRGEVEAKADLRLARWLAGEGDWLLLVALTLRDCCLPLSCRPFLFLFRLFRLVCSSTPSHVSISSYHSIFASSQHFITSHITSVHPAVFTSSLDQLRHLASLHQSIDREHFVARHGYETTRLRLDRTITNIGGSQALYILVLSIQKEQAKKQLMLLDHLTDAAHYTMATSDTFMPSPREMADASQQPQYFASSHYNEQYVNKNVPLPSLLATNPFAPTPNASIPTTPGSVAGRKRSRGDEDEIELDGSLPTPASESGNILRSEPVMGPGMALVYPGDPSYPMAAETQSGTWVDEKMARPFAVQELRRPSMTSRKSQRMDASGAGSDNLAQLVLPPDMRSATTEPLIDEVTRKLGISWARMDSSEARQINQAAYAKFIANHYSSLKNVKVWFENAALPGYLVQAANVYSGVTEFYLFSNDLTEARLVTRDADQLIPRLQMLPALHLAAPGGQIKAEMSPVMVAQNEVNGYVKKEEESNGTLQGCMQDHVFRKGYHPVHREPEGICAAHSMELD
jgi:hypothetical protein